MVLVFKCKATNTQHEREDRVKIFQISKQWVLTLVKTIDTFKVNKIELSNDSKYLFILTMEGNCQIRCVDEDFKITEIDNFDEALQYQKIVSIKYWTEQRKVNNKVNEYKFIMVIIQGSGRNKFCTYEVTYSNRLENIYTTYYPVTEYLEPILFLSTDKKTVASSCTFFEDNDEKQKIMLWSSEFGYL